MKKLFFFIGLFSASFCNVEITKATFTEFIELALEDIRANHQRLKASVDSCYQEVEKHFDPGTHRSYKEDFNFKKGVNLASVGVQWIIKTDKKAWITDFEILKDNAGKELVASNTSSFQWKSPIIKADKFHMLSWPITKRRNFNIFDLMVKNAPMPSTFEDKNNPIYRQAYENLITSLESILQRSISLIKRITEKNITFSKLKQNEKLLLQTLENFFYNRKFLFERNGIATNYYVEKSNKKRAIENFLSDYNSGALEQEEIDIEAIVEREIIGKEKINLLDRWEESELSVYSYLLDVEKDRYKEFTTEDNIVKDIQKVYPLDIENEMDIFHSEPLLSWWIDRNIEKDRNNILAKFFKRNPQEEVLDVFPVFFFYTERQTCPSCENIVQRKACNQYIPIIAFNNLYSPDYILLSGSKVSFHKQSYTHPYSMLSQRPNLSLNFLSLKKMMTIKEATDLHSESLQVDYERIFKRDIDFMKQVQTYSKENANQTESLLQSLEEIQNKSKENIDILTKNDKDNENKPACKAFLLNSSFQDIVIEWIRQQVMRETELINKTDSFIQTQEDDLSSEQNVLRNLRNNFQRLPIQYKIY